MSSSIGLPSAFGNSPVVWFAGVVGVFAWWAFRQDKAATRILLLLLALLLSGPICDAVLKAENAGEPLKFDYFLYRIDQSLGISAFSVARTLTEWQRSALYQVYESLSLAMVAWYGINLKQGAGKPNRLLIAYAVAFLTGPCLYLLLPACGPRHAFGSAFPMGDPVVPLVRVTLNNWPNAVPSLHVATALLLVLFSGRNRMVRSVAWLYLAGTVLATLAFEHYLIDLIVAVPFACFAVRMAEGRFRQAACHLAVVLAWMLSIRYATPLLLASPAVLRILACSTVGIAAFSMAGRRKCGPVPRLPAIGTEVDTPLVALGLRKTMV